MVEREEGSGSRTQAADIELSEDGVLVVMKMVKPWYRQRELEASYTNEEKTLSKKNGEAYHVLIYTIYTL